MSESHIASDENKKTVKMLVAFGIPQASIALKLGVSVDTLDRHYRYELDMGLHEAVEKVAGTLFKKATVDEDVKAQQFFLRTRARWVEPKEENKRDTLIEQLVTDKLASLSDKK